MNSREIRNAFLNFFRNKNHNIVQSAPMVIKNDPTLMFTNAGMNQFKDIFLGNSAIKDKRVANSQKCLRVSGKHNDLDEVGHDTYHHTMFEMLGNWSFGDYFKQEAIDWGWSFLVEELGLPKDRLYATIFEGSDADGIKRDEESFTFWKKYLPVDRIIDGNKKDNFWEMGDVGPCGPCSEIHIDLRDETERKKVDGKTLINKDHPLVIEIWNLVFIEFNRKISGGLEALPHKHVDTGMGFERLCMALQGKKSNYDTDVFQPLIQQIASISGKKYGKNEEIDIAMRVVADHLRAIAFSIADGQLPSNNKAGYVIRRILRRGVRYGYTFLGLSEPFINKLVSVLIDTMGDAFPELTSQKELIEKVIREEEAAFLRTLETGIKLLNEIIKKKSDKNKVVSGKIAFELYDTYGFPLDLTELILKENDLTIDKHEFEKKMEQQKNRSRSAANIDTEDWVILQEDDKEEFVGYDYSEIDVKITRYRKVKSKKKEAYHLVFNITPFYAESGGQVGDTGYIQADDEKILIEDTQKENNLIIHITSKLPENPKVLFKAVVLGNKRESVANNHTATHLLHNALKKVLGSHVEQKGSLVHPNYLRFDFSHFQKVTDEEIEKIETVVNESIRKNIFLEEKRNIPMAEAKNMGAISLFGEKYGDTVRVIRFDESIELCGGIHVSATGQIGFFKILSESAVAAGIRRVEAITGAKAEKFIMDQLSKLKEISMLFNNPKNINASIENLIEENKELQKKLEHAAKDQLKTIKKDLIDKKKEVDGIHLIAEKIDVDSAALLKDLAFQLKDQIKNLVLILGTELDGKANLAVMISDNLVKEKGLHAGNTVREAAKEIKGGGGGQPFFATAGGKDPDGIHKAIKRAKEIIFA